MFDVFPDNPTDSKTHAISDISLSMQFVLQNKTAHTMPIQRHDIRNATGVFEERYWSPTNKPVLSEDNEVQYIIHRVEDVTEFVKLKKLHLQNAAPQDDLSDRLFAIETELFQRSQELERLNEQLLKKNRESSIEAENLAKDIFDYKVALDAADIVAITDEKGTIQYVNESFCKISKYGKEELVGQNHRIINSGYHPKDFFKNLWQTIGSGTIWKGEIRNRAKDGTFYWVNTTIVPFIDAKGKPYKYLSIRSDITENKQSIENLEKSEEQYRDIFSNSLVAIFTTDVATRKIIEVNERCASLFGYESTEDFLVSFDVNAHYLNSDDRKKNWVILMENGELQHVQQLRKNDGNLIWVSIFTKLNQSKTLAHTVVLDVTSQISFQEELSAKVTERTLELTESLAREKELNEMKSNFVGIASHEFRTPLGTILSSISLLTKYTEDCQKDSITKHIDRITSCVNHLNAILNDFLALEKLRKGTVDCEVNEFNLRDFITETINEIDYLAKTNGQRILYSHKGESYVNQSAKILKNILLNLLSNASKYSGEGKKIKVSSKVNENSMTISIRDYGIGIPFKDQKKLFTEFFRAGNAKNIQGTGLGLVIVKNYAALLEGTITFSSNENKGSMFTVTLPRYLPEAW
ncbi:MAG: PAS domain-containing sensor histidine kinase [Flavobacterium sp. JAD_PAG50586_2]|nr:MAG: PAS domain-containing sensor histidine kinase [Flavobacterium sp. JAD_PAG50586_2]